MIPLRDTIRARRRPIVNWALIGLNVLAFLIEYTLGAERLHELIQVLGVVPSGFNLASDWWTLFTAMFLHAGWWHLISNMLTLFIFGDNVEDRLGHVAYLLFYLAGGLVAGGFHLVAYSSSSVPTVGASGAIAAVLGAYLVLFPRARVVTLVPIFYFLRIVYIPAFIYLGFWFVSQLFNGFLALTAVGAMQAGGVAWWAHIGGFVFGLAVLGVIRLVSPRRPPPPPPPHYYYVRPGQPWRERRPPEDW